MTGSAVPEGYSTVTPYLIVEDADALIGFVQDALGGELVYRLDREDGQLWHGEVQIGDSRLMLSQATPEWPAQPGLFSLYVADTDSAYARALERGATSVMEPADQFYGDRQAGVRDAVGNQWWFATRIEEVAPDEVQRRAREFLARQSA